MWVIMEGFGEFLSKFAFASNLFTISKLLNQIDLNVALYWGRGQSIFC